ncbi:MAG: hypothetical protein P8N76_20645 [Pirellulaceae bacterium]|nr:hypothetical protein [Pirellulaceae bacterium]
MNKNRHIYLSPHHDDAVLSYGGTIYRLSEAGHAVTVLSVFTAGLSSWETVSPHAKHLLRLWRLQRTSARRLDRTPSRPLCYSPLGIGRHVDHQLVHLAGKHLAAEGCRVLFYEDDPYCDPDFQSVLPPESRERIASRVSSLTPQASCLSASHLAGKLRELRAYYSQFPVTFGSEENMAERISQVRKERLGHPDSKQFAEFPLINA